MTRSPAHPGRVLLLLLAAVLGAACSGDSDTSRSISTTPSTSASIPQPDPPPVTDEYDRPRDTALQCDPLDEHRCLLPWPNDAFTRPDATTSTGRRIDIEPSETPRNLTGAPIDISDQNRADGFSPASTILTFVADLDPAASGLPDSEHVADSLDPDSPIVLLDSDTGERLAYWAELDSQAGGSPPLLLVHPAANLPEGHRIVVAVRDLVATDGSPIQRSSAFDGALDRTPEPPERARDFDRMFADLRAADVDPANALLTWDFTVASGDSLHGRAIAMRDRAVERLVDAAPTARVVRSADSAGVRTVDGEIEVPNFLADSRLRLDDDDLPVIIDEAPSVDVPFRCVLPIEPAAPVPPIVYGHGLLGSRGEVDALGQLAAAGVAAACAVDWIGMSTGDIEAVSAILGDLSLFPRLADRLQQALVNVQFLARALRSPQGLVTKPEFRTVDDTPAIAPDALQFVGNSQGGILGGAASALTDQWSRVVLGVPGSNYNLLLTRSSNWPRFQTTIEAAYPDAADRLIALELIQLLWDRGENSGYVQHLTTDPLPGATAKEVLLIGAYGDHQVANVATAVLARTIGARIRLPIVDDGRSGGMFGLIDELDPLPTRGPALVVWDYGTPTPPVDNRAPTDPDFGSDPHGFGASDPRVVDQALTFLFTGQVTAD